ncbi:hypothetical protein EII25_03415 [Erysipelotrichaceae bacterium OH741_COT-311]|nr:hypothetical protein EII25_03415 [Erysipelotrichaceae bacterium OH741_COT-311]
MNNANKLLENCGYMLLKETSTEALFGNPSNCSTWIKFNKTKRYVHLGDNKCFTTRTILAIYAKCKELGWFNDGN